jgi:hypothetical protein
MIKLLKTFFMVTVVVTRCYLLYQMIKGLYINHYNPEYSLDNVQWYFYALMLDLYIVKIVDNSNSEDIYSKKE